MVAMLGEDAVKRKTGGASAERRTNVPTKSMKEDGGSEEASGGALAGCAAGGRCENKPNNIKTPIVLHAEDMFSTCDSGTASKKKRCNSLRKSHVAA